MLRWFCLVLCYVYNFTLLACTSSFLKLSLILNIQKDRQLLFSYYFAVRDTKYNLCSLYSMQCL